MFLNRKALNNTNNVFLFLWTGKLGLSSNIWILITKLSLVQLKVLWLIKTFNCLMLALYFTSCVMECTILWHDYAAKIDFLWKNINWKIKAVKEPLVQMFALWAFHKVIATGCVQQYQIDTACKTQHSTVYSEFTLIDPGKGCTNTKNTV